MQPLKLSPLPCVIPSEETSSVICGDCGFVDEAVVRALMAGPVFSQEFENMRPDPSSMRENELDYAGWSFSAATVASSTPGIDRRPGPPMLTEPGPVISHHGPRRWWLSGMAGAACSLLSAVTLLQHPTHRSRESEPFVTTRPPTVAPPRMDRGEPARKTAPQLMLLNTSTVPRPTTGD